MKNYTTVEQSKKLLELGIDIDSADMCWTNHCYGSIRSSLTVSSKTIDEYKNLLTQFADLIDIDVFKKYNSDLAAYKIKRENYILLDQEIKQYEESINKVYLYNKTWNEKDYIEILQKEKTNYSNLYNDIKKLENNINILEKKQKNINEQITIQRSKDVKEIEDKKKTIDDEIEKTRNKILNIKTKIIELNLEHDRLKMQISDVNDEIELLNIMQEELTNKEYKCEYCGTVITNENAKKKIATSLRKKAEKKSKISNSLLISLTKNEQSLAYYENELSNLKSTLKNDIEFKQQDYNFYIKKSLKILELEAVRDDVIKKIDEFKKQYENNPKTHKENFISIKDRISKYELSLENLQKIKKNKETFKEKYNMLNQLKDELLQLNNNLKLYKKFIEIYYKIYEQKASDYFGKDIKFKLFKFNNFDFQEIFEVYYKNIEYNQLNKKYKDEFDNIYLEKIAYFS